MYRIHGVQINDVAQVACQELLIGFRANHTVHLFQKTFEMFIELHFTFGITVVFLIFGKSGQPFRCCQECVCQRNDKIPFLGIDTLGFIALYGGFVYTKPLAEIAHGEIQFRSSLLDSLTDLFCGEHIWFIHRLFTSVDIIVAHIVAICNSYFHIVLSLFIDSVAKCVDK